MILNPLHSSDCLSSRLPCPLPPPPPSEASVPLIKHPPPPFCAAVHVVAAAAKKDPSKRVVITGIGLCSVFGNDPEKFYERLLAGESGIDLITR